MNAIRSLRAKLGLTQKQLADMAGTNASTVSRWEHGLWSIRLCEMQRIVERSNGAVRLEDFVPKKTEEA